MKEPERIEKVEIEELNEAHMVKRKILQDVDPEKKKELSRQIRKNSLLFIIEISILAVILFLIYAFFIGAATVNGNSMYPTLQDKNVVIYEKRTPEYQVGDVVVIARPDGEEFVKRIVAVAGDTVNIQNGKLYVNGEEFRVEAQSGETRVPGEETENPLVIQENQVYVLGDNRENSEDSRNFGPVELDDVKGKLLYYIGKTK